MIGSLNPLNHFLNDRRVQFKFGGKITGRASPVGGAANPKQERRGMSRWPMRSCRRSGAATFSADI